MNVRVERKLLKFMKKFSRWFITTNPSSSCYGKLYFILSTLKNIEYSFIKHNADDEEKTEHYHLCLFFKRELKSFEEIKELFPGAHIEETTSSRYLRTIQYLVHKNNPEKEQYSSFDIVTNLSSERLSEILAGDGYVFKRFDPDDIIDIFESYYQAGTLSITNLVKDYGMVALKPYYHILKDFVERFIKEH